MELQDSINQLGGWDLIALAIVLACVSFVLLLGRNAKSQLVQEKHDEDERVKSPRDFVEMMESHNKNCIIFYGSQTGTAEGYAGQLAKEGKSRFGLGTAVADLEDYDFDNLASLPRNKVAVFVLATYGEGEPTDNAASFYEFLTSPSPDSPKSLENLSYVAFGLGNKTYEHFNAVIHKVSQTLDALGASRIGPVGEGDDGAGTMEDDFLTWKETMWSALATKLDLKQGQAEYEPSFEITERGDSSPISDQVFLGEPNKTHLAARSDVLTCGPFNHRNPFVAPISLSKDLFGDASPNRKCLHIELDIGNTGLSYQAGDHLAVWPCNPSNEVDRLLTVLGLQDKRDGVIDIESLDPSVKVPFPIPTTYDTIMRYYLEICGPVSRQLISNMAPFAPNGEIRQAMGDISRDKERFYAETHYTNLAQFMERVGKGEKWSRLPLSILIENLPGLQPRYYSISSSPLVQPNTVSITVSVKSECNVPGRTQQDPFCGVASNYLLALHQSRHTGRARFKYDIEGPRRSYGGVRVPIHLRHSNFKLPANPSLPVIMVGPGTGVAPFRGFIQERAELARQGKTVGYTMLFFGCRRSNEDFFYENEWKVSYHRAK